MTMSPGDPGPTDPAQGSAVPPYEGRRESADVDGRGEAAPRGGERRWRHGPVESDEQKAPEPAGTPRGAAASPADEQPGCGVRRSRPG